MTAPSPAAPGPRAAILWAVATAAVLAALAPFPGVSRTEAASAAASDRAAAFWTALPRDAAAAFRTALEAPPGADPDLADEMVRKDLGLVRPDEVILPLE